jgi:transposase
VDVAQRIAELEEQVAARDRVIAEQRITLAQQSARIAQLEKQVADLTQMLAKLTEKLGKHSGNSHLPPSSDGPGGRGKSGGGSPKKGSGGKRGGQAGHKGHRRELLPPDQVDHVINLFPEACGNCWEVLAKVPDADAARFQVTEVPPLRPEVTEYRCHSVTCACGHTTGATVDGVVPTSPFGPRLMALVALLTGVYHISRRRTGALLRDAFGVAMSLGAISTVEGRVSEALAGPSDEAHAVVDAAAVKHADATSWLEAGKLRSLWVLATAAATVFRIVTDGAAATIQPLFGACRGILVSDRATVFSFWDPLFRQICWAHLLRKFVSFSERDGPAGQIGRELLGYGSLTFRYWHDFRDGKISRATFSGWMEPVRLQVEACLARAVAADLAHVSGSCADILAHREALWTFVERDDVEPTNNHAEQEVRGFVLWRKRSFGAQSARGHRFAERVMTVSHTARKQKRNTFAFLVAACEAKLANAPAPSLFAAAAV